MYVCMYVCNAAAGDGWRDDEYPVSIANHISCALHHIRRDHSQAAAGTTNTSHACTSTVCMYVLYVIMLCLYVCMYVCIFQLCSSNIFVRSSFLVTIHLLLSSNYCMYVCMHACMHVCLSHDLAWKNV